MNPDMAFDINFVLVLGVKLSYTSNWNMSRTDSHLPPYLSTVNGY